MTALPDAALSADKRAVLLDANTKGSPLERVQKRSALPLPLSCKPKFVPKNYTQSLTAAPPLLQTGRLWSSKESGGWRRKEQHR